MTTDSSTRADEDVLWIVTLGDPPEQVLRFCMERTVDGDLDWLIVPVYRTDIEAFVR